MKERFEGINRPQLITALQQQPFVRSNPALAERLADKGTLIEFARGQDIITQGASDDDVFMLIMGAVAILVNGAQINMRRAGEYVGEMAAIEPSLTRSATVRALEPVVLLKVSSGDFLEIGKEAPEIWLPIARELSKRLHQRNATILVPNKEPRLFVISSSEARPIAHAIRDSLEKDIFIKVWDEDVFFAGGYPLEALEAQLTEADFAVAVAG